VMQNNKQHNCPFCRARSVFDANSGKPKSPPSPQTKKKRRANHFGVDNLDQELAAFLKKWFPDEVKAKQRYNEHMAGIDQYGEVYAEQKCVVM
jgi:E3 ubiquitin-protein ligase BAH